MKNLKVCVLSISLALPLFSQAASLSNILAPSSENLPKVATERNTGDSGNVVQAHLYLYSGVVQPTGLCNGTLRGQTVFTDQASPLDFPNSGTLGLTVGGLEAFIDSSAEINPADVTCIELDLYNSSFAHYEPTNGNVTSGFNVSCQGAVGSATCQPSETVVDVALQ